jgi:hypothetical protein
VNIRRSSLFSIRRCAALLAMVAIAWNALWPTIASAQPAKPGVPMVICTPTGFKTITQGESPEEKPEHGSKVHCALCAPAGDQPVPVSVPGVRDVARTPPVLAPAPELTALPATPRLSPPSQAPPQHS